MDASGIGVHRIEDVVPVCASEAGLEGQHAARPREIRSPRLRAVPGNLQGAGLAVPGTGEVASNAATELPHADAVDVGPAAATRSLSSCISLDETEKRPHAEKWSNREPLVVATCVSVGSVASIRS
jgi:hypothetical protein